MREDLNDIYEDAENALTTDELDIDYIIESIQNQVSSEELMSSSVKKNYLKAFENNIELSDLTDEERSDVRETMYSKIIDIISDRFNIYIQKSDVTNKSLAKNLYKFFILNYTDNVEQFLEMYIIENKKDISDELERKDINSKRIEGIQSKKISIIINNISFVIEIINSSNISFREFLEYILKHPEVKSSSEEMLEYLDEYIDDADYAMEIIMEQLVNEEEGFGNIYTELQRRLFSRFSSIV